MTGRSALGLERPLLLFDSLQEDIQPTAVSYDCVVNGDREDMRSRIRRRLVVDGATGGSMIEIGSAGIDVKWRRTRHRDVWRRARCRDKRRRTP